MFTEVVNAIFFPGKCCQYLNCDIHFYAIFQFNVPWKVAQSWVWYTNMGHGNWIPHTKVLPKFGIRRNSNCSSVFVENGNL